MKYIENNKFNLEIKKSIEEKLKDKDDLSEREIANLVYEYPAVYEEEGDESRWSRFIQTVVEVGDKNYLINWQRGLTEYQENTFLEQPKECILKEEEVIVTRTVICSKPIL